MKAAMAMAMGVAKPVATNPRFQTSRMGSSSHAPCRQTGSVPAASPDAQADGLLAGAHGLLPGAATAVVLPGLLAGRPDGVRRQTVTRGCAVRVTLNSDTGGAPHAY